MFLILFASFFFKSFEKHDMSRQLEIVLKARLYLIRDTDVSNSNHCTIQINLSFYNLYHEYMCNLTRL